MIIWTGFGFVVAIVTFAALVLTELVSEKVSGDQQFYQDHPSMILIAMVVAATFTYGFHRLLLL